MNERQMTPQEIQSLCQQRIAIALERIANYLESKAPREPPNHQKILEEFKKFDWSSISAEVKAQDQYGASLVSWNNQLYQRRSPDNVYEPAVWFSRCIGKDSEGKNEYEKLITFRPAKSYQAQPISRKAESYIK